LNEFATRLRSLGASHDLLIQEDWRGAPIQALVKKQLDFVRPDHSAMHIDGPALLLSTTACQNFGLGLHELATKAVKHGAFSGPRGTVDVRWRVNNESERWFEFEWVERGGPSGKGIDTQRIWICDTQRSGPDSVGRYGYARHGSWWNSLVAESATRPGGRG
jgi:two-component sensor histidine kinase